MSGDRDSSIGELFRTLSAEMKQLVAKELELFRIEMTEKTRGFGSRVAGSAGTLSGAAVCGLMAVGSLTATIILALALVMPAWGAALIVTIAYTIIAAALALRGKRQIDDIKMPVPTQTIQTLREDVEWAKTRVSSMRK